MVETRDSGAAGASLSRLETAGLAAVALLFAGIVVFHSDFVPYWDAKGYFDCIARATQTAFDLRSYRCFGHTTIAYLLPLAFTQSLAPWSLFATDAANALLGIASIVAFHALIRRLFPDRTDLEYVLATSLYALAPLFVVHAIFLNLDYGLTTYFVLFLAFLVSGRFWIASACAIAMVLSKETGAAVFAAAMAAYFVAFGARGRRSLPLLTVPLALAAYVAVTRLSDPSPGTLVSSYAVVSMLPDPIAALSFNPADPGIRSLLADLFVLNWQWIYTAALAAAACVTLVSRRAGAARTAMTRSRLFLSLLLVELVYLVTRYRDYNNARYVLAASPVLIALFFGVLPGVTANGVVRRVTLAAAAGLLLASNFRTIDPMSKAVFGTFPFGSHAMLDMPSLLGGPRLDALVYNLESLQFGYLFGDMMQDVRPAPGTVLVMGNATYNFPPAVDARTYRLTPDPSRALPLSVLANVPPDQPGGAAPFLYLAFANADNRLLERLERTHELLGSRQYERRGYSAGLYRLRLSP